MGEKNQKPHDTIGLRRDIVKTTPNRVTALWLFGVFMLISVSYIGTWIGATLFGGFNDLTYVFAFFAVLLFSSVIGWFTIIIQENAQDIIVKIVREG